jgi:hypothetical protein
MNTIELEIIYCCKEPEFDKYIFDNKLSDDILKQLIKYQNDDLDLYIDNPFNDLFEHIISQKINEIEYKDCDFKLYITVC